MQDICNFFYTGGFTIGSRHVPLVEKKYRAAVAMSPLATLASGINRTDTVLQLDMGEERMKVASTDPGKKTLTVERGFENTGRTDHAQGDRVFGPVYVGNKQEETGEERQEQQYLVHLTRGDQVCP